MVDSFMMKTLVIENFEILYHMTVWPMSVLCKNPNYYIILVNVKTKQIFQNNSCVI
ncbi:MAG: hypothetical protein HW410_980 [Nitrosarchaeum sp.]|jgi:hypothetical protein|nr:hypothetical protein [Nitrosarchaeum sp.]